MPDEKDFEIERQKAKVAYLSEMVDKYREECADLRLMLAKAKEQNIWQ